MIEKNVITFEDLGSTNNFIKTNVSNLDDGTISINNKLLKKSVTFIEISLKEIY